MLLAAYAQWGTDCLNRLNGMFAFAIYDAPQQRLFLARDRAGEKPLFYRLDQGILYFASELKAFLAHPSLPRRIDAEALDCFATWLWALCPAIVLFYRVIASCHRPMPLALTCGMAPPRSAAIPNQTDLLPLEFDRQWKQGFSIPLGEWLRAGPFRDLFCDTLASTDCLFDATTVDGLLQGQDRGYSNGDRLFALVQFELWRREYGIHL